MALDLGSIPDANDRSADDGPRSGVLTDLPTAPSRRGFLRAMGYAGLAMGAAALTVGWVVRRGNSAIADTSPTGLTEWRANNCTDAYGTAGYTQQADLANSAYTYDAPACWGAPISNKHCRYGWHANPTTGHCGNNPNNHNGWRWTVNGRTYRCSDGYPAGSTTLTICRQRVVP